MSLPFLPLFLPYLSVPLLEAAGDECRRFSVGKKTLFLDLFFVNFPMPAIDSSMTGGVTPVCRRPPPRRSWPEWPSKRRGRRSPVPAREEPRRRRRRRRRKRKEKKKKKRKEEKEEKKRKEKEEKEKKKRKEKKRKEKKKSKIK